MKTLEGSWKVMTNSALLVDQKLIPGRLISLYAGSQLQAVVLYNQQLERYRLQYPGYMGTLGGFQELLRDFAPMKLRIQTWAPLRYWEFLSSASHGHRIAGRNIFSEEVKSSSIKAVKFVTDAYASVLTYSSRQDVWEVIPLWGVTAEFDDFKAYCQKHQILENPKADDNFMRHYKRV